MPNRVVIRAANASETAYLRSTLQKASTTAMRWRQCAVNALVLWAASLLGVVLIWIGIAWVVRQTAAIDFGFRSVHAAWILGASSVVCALYAVASSVRWTRSLKDYRPDLQADIHTGQVAEEHYALIATKRFQEPEHGGLIYFWQTTDNKVLTLYDYESHDLGVYEDVPLKSTFTPKSELIMVRAPHTGLVIETTFSGQALQVDSPIDLTAEPEHWPESESYTNIPWHELEDRLSPGWSQPAVDQHQR